MSPDSPAAPARQAWALPDDVAETIQSQVVPRMLVAHRVGALSPGQVREASEALEGPDVDRLVALLTGAHDAETDLFVDALLQRGVTSEAIYLDLLAPAARQLGELWSDDLCDFVVVSVALGRMQRILRNLSQLFLVGVDPQRVVGRVLLAGVPGEQHTLGLFMVAEFFVRGGWLVTVGPPMIQEDVNKLLREQWYDVVGFSVACDTRLSLVNREIRKVRRVSCNRGLRVMVGGRIFNERPELVDRVGADASARDGQEAPRVAVTLLEGAKARQVANAN